MKRVVVWSGVFIMLAGLITGCQPGPNTTTVSLTEEAGATASLPAPAVRTETLPPPPSPTAETSPTATTGDITGEAPPDGIPMPLHGVESHNIKNPRLADLAAQAGTRLVRMNDKVVWYKVEPQPGERRWEELAELEAAVISLRERGMEPMVIIRGTPEFAQAIPGSYCGPIRPAQLRSFAAFLIDLVERYSAEPYNITYWELWNEPDVDPALVAPEVQFGCWGNAADPFYGGGMYAEMLKIGYQAIKVVDPDARVVLGGLLLDCDPANPPESGCLSGQFLEGVLQAGGGEFFDILGYHGYAAYSSVENGDLNSLNWKARGGVVEGKVAYLREVMAKYGLDKPLLDNEGSLICHPANKIDCEQVGENFLNAQAEFVVQLFVRNWANNVAGTIWYQLEGKGWREGGLLGVDPDNPKPAYRAYSYLNAKLQDAIYTGKDIGQAGLWIYRFWRTDGDVWVIWPKNGQAVGLQLPPNTKEITDELGNVVAAQENMLTVDGVMYVEINR